MQTRFLLPVRALVSVFKFTLVYIICYWRCCCREFYQRVIVCNSLVWSCGVTGRPNLTYSEAIAYEEKALAIINRFPQQLRLVSFLALRVISLALYSNKFWFL